MPYVLWCTNLLTLTALCFDISPFQLTILFSIQHRYTKEVLLECVLSLCLHLCSITCALLVITRYRHSQSCLQVDVQWWNLWVSTLYYQSGGWFLLPADSKENKPCVSKGSIFAFNVLSGTGVLPSTSLGCCTVACGSLKRFLFFDRIDND